MNAWIILLFLLMGNNGRGSCQGQNSCSNNNNNCGNNTGCGCNSGRDNDCGGNNSGMNNDCGCDDLKFEPRFEARPFRDNRETCGCEEKED